jgi:hypothetical protein
MMYKTDFVTFHHMPMLGHIQARSKHVPKDIVWVWEVYSQTAFENVHHVPSAGQHPADVVYTLTEGWRCGTGCCGIAIKHARCLQMAT